MIESFISRCLLGGISTPHHSTNPKGFPNLVKVKYNNTDRSTLYLIGAET